MILILIHYNSILALKGFAVNYGKLLNKMSYNTCMQVLCIVFKFDLALKFTSSVPYNKIASCFLGIKASFGILNWKSPTWPIHWEQRSHPTGKHLHREFSTMCY